MAYTLSKTLEKMTQDLGPYSPSKWRLGKSQFVRYMHSPLSEVPLIRYLFELSTEYPGSKRTPNVAVTFSNV